MIGFVVAMEKEAKLYIDSVSSVDTHTMANKQIYVGKCAEYDFALIVAGIGKVNTAMATEILLSTYDIEYVVNFGVAGGKEGSGLQAGDVVLLGKVCQYDFDLSEIDDVSIGYMQDYDTIYYPTAYTHYKGDAFKICTGATGDRFTKKQYFLDIIKGLQAQVVDMESGAIAQVCYAHRVPYISIKLISDVDGVEGSIFEQYATNVASVCSKIPNAIKELVAHIDI